MFNMLKYQFFFSQPKSPVNVLSFLSSLLHAYVLFDGYKEKEDSTQDDPFFILQYIIDYFEAVLT